ncbi:unnamed protein product [Brachionus calyciflorus]|uniref:G-protein coupled receptors family 1 profile domain-containing protein n=1 Tax=Brachionus calyciflorus TaxID=104777 RepID=A0A813U9U2_9BILA|nr:unnamed protein product [Brachionus calyciflorus]
MIESEDHANFTYRWVDYVLGQITESSRSYSSNRIIEIDYNLTESKGDFPEYLLKVVKHEINNSFGLISDRMVVIFSIIFGLIFLFGILSNFFIVFSFYRSKHLRTYRNIFIVNLAISDILLCSICGPLTLFRCIDLNWKLGRILCKLGPGLQTANVLVSTLSITAIAVDRWNIIVNSGKNAKNYNLYFCIFIIWTVSFLISIPSFIIIDEKIIRIKQTKEVLYKLCEETWHNHNSKYFFGTLLIFFQYILPVVIVGSTNYKICSFLHLNVPKMFRKRDKKRGNTDSDYREQNKEERSRGLLLSRTSFFIEKIVRNQERFSRSKKILFVVFFTFSVCWFPVALCNLFLDFSDSYFINGSKIAVILLFANVIALSSTSLNPIIYGLMNKNFKQEFSRIFKSNSNYNASQNNLQQQQQNQKSEVLRETSVTLNKTPRCALSNNTYV